MRRSLRLGSVVALALLLTGCPSPPTHTAEHIVPGFGYADVDRIEVYTYRYAGSPSDVRLSVLTDRREIATWVDYLTDLPASPANLGTDTLVGADADGFRFHLRDGSTWEVTHLFCSFSCEGGPQNTLVWPDGTVQATDYGSPSGLTGTPVDAAERPKAVVG
ncbi:MAG: hypothetical protein KDB60_08325 [Propionibacteriaceae bacterium]|nr:hypothetical protein [Propionibacteriaceae bacterium]